LLYTFARSIFSKIIFRRSCSVRVCCRVNSASRCFLLSVSIIILWTNKNPRVFSPGVLWVKLCSVNLHDPPGTPGKSLVYDHYLTVTKRWASFVANKHHCLLTSLYCSVFQRPCQQLLESFFVVFLQHLRITLFANLSLLYSYLVSVSTPICKSEQTVGSFRTSLLYNVFYYMSIYISCQEPGRYVVILQHFEKFSRPLFIEVVKGSLAPFNIFFEPWLTLSPLLFYVFLIN